MIIHDLAYSKELIFTMPFGLENTMNCLCGKSTIFIKLEKRDDYCTARSSQIDFNLKKAIVCIVN